MKKSVHAKKGKYQAQQQQQQQYWFSKKKLTSVTATSIFSSKTVIDLKFYLCHGLLMNEYTSAQSVNGD